MKFSILNKQTGMSVGKRDALDEAVTLANNFKKHSIIHEYEVYQQVLVFATDTKSVSNIEACSELAPWKVR